MARGGARNGRPGASYGNRTDLNAPKPLAPTAVGGQTYGQAGQQLAAQKAVPMAPPPVAAPAGGAPPAPTPVPQGPPPGSRGAFNRPTERPLEPVTAGVPSGPGPGPESVVGLGGAQQDQTVGALLNRLAAQPGASANVQAMASAVNAGRT